MPKLLSQIRENALVETRRVLNEEGYDALTMRTVAASCGIAVGTLYNYFPSKEYLTGCVVLEDWNDVYNAMRRAVRQAAAPQEGVEEIYGLMCGFADAHQYLRAFRWSDAPGEFTYAERHSVLLEQICSLLEDLCSGCGLLLEPDLITFLAESILNSSVKQYPYARIRAAIQKLLA